MEILSGRLPWDEMVSRWNPITYDLSIEKDLSIDKKKPKKSNIGHTEGPLKYNTKSSICRFVFHPIYILITFPHTTTSLLRSARSVGAGIPAIPSRPILSRSAVLEGMLPEEPPCLSKQPLMVPRLMQREWWLLGSC